MTEATATREPLGRPAGRGNAPRPDGPSRVRTTPGGPAAGVGRAGAGGVTTDPSIFQGVDA